MKRRVAFIVVLLNIDATYKLLYFICMHVIEISTSDLAINDKTT